MKKTGILIGGLAVLGVAVSLFAWLSSGPSNSVEELIRSEDPNQRGAAAARLGASADAEATRTLRELARDKNAWVAIKAVRALGRQKTEDRRDALGSMVNDKALGEPARAEAAATLGSFEQANPVVLTETMAKDPSPRVRAGAAKGLVRLRKPETLPELVKALSDPDTRVRAYAITAIHHMIARRYNFDPRAPVQTQQREIERIKAYLRKCGVL